MIGARLVLALLACVGLVGCQRPEPRSRTYFVSHIPEAEAVLDACRSGEKRGPECANAEAGAIAAENARRLRMYRQGFAR